MQRDDEMGLCYVCGWLKPQSDMGRTYLPLRQQRAKKPRLVAICGECFMATAAILDEMGIHDALVMHGY